MCILKDDSMCPLLSPEEMRAQHNFEERKGSYPKALADRLHEQGIMPRDVHLRHSIERQIEHASKALHVYHGEYGGGFHPRMDCSPEESQYMAGVRHNLPRDENLPQELWDRLVPRFIQGRHHEFELRLANCTSKNQASYLAQYPECAVWLAEYMHAVNANESRLEHVISLVTKNSKLLAAFTLIASPQALQNACTHIFCSLLNDGLLRRNAELSKEIEDLLPHPHKGSFSAFQLESNSIEKIPHGSSKQDRKYRLRRRQLRHTLKNWTRRLARDVSLSDVVRTTATHLIGARQEKTDSLPLGA